MRETPLSNCEREFVLNAVAEQKRLDGRQVYDYRKLKISFGVDRGCCQVQIGDTRVLVQVACEITTPKASRPTDGVLFVNVELSPMASPGFEIGRPSEYSVELTRLLERCIKESRCVDTESLCIVAGQKVWALRVDVHVLNQQGNILDCASIAAITALAHFRRPDVTLSGEDVTVHTLEEREPLPLSLHHMPICCTFAFFSQGKHVLVDPTLIEEKVMDGKMVIGMNKHREICMLQITGQMLLLKEQVLRCSNIAVVKVTEISALILKALENDKVARSRGEKFGFVESHEPATVTHQEKAEQESAPPMDDVEEVESSDDVEEMKEDIESVQVLDKGLAVIGHGGSNTWEIVDSSDDEVLEPTIKPGNTSKQCINIDSDSEEEETITVTHKEVNMVEKTRRKKKK